MSVHDMDRPIVNYSNFYIGPLEQFSEKYKFGNMGNNSINAPRIYNLIWTCVINDAKFIFAPSIASDGYSFYEKLFNKNINMELFIHINNLMSNEIVLSVIDISEYFRDVVTIKERPSKFSEEEFELFRKQVLSAIMELKLDK